MNKKALVEFMRVAVLKSEAVADNQKTVHFKRVEQAVGYAFDSILTQIPLTEEGKAEIESYFVKHYYNQSVSESNGYRYFGISDSLVPIGEGKGVWYVQPSGGGKPLPKSRRPKIATYRHLPVGGALNQTVWRLGNISDDRQIVIENIGDSPLEDIRKVDYGVVRAFDSYGDTEEISMPDGRFDLMTQLVVTWFNGAYTDNVNNNA